MRTVCITLMLALLSLAGCTTTEPEPATFLDPGPEGAIPVGEDHNHTDPGQHRHARNAQVLSTVTLQEWGASADMPVGAHALAVHGDMVAVAVNGAGNGAGQQGFHLIDASDPEDLQHVSFFRTGHPIHGDRTIAWSTDGTYVFIGFEGGPRPGVAAVDVSDPAFPHEVAFWDDPLGYGPHTISTGTIDGEIHVFALIYGVNILHFDPGRDDVPDVPRAPGEEAFKLVGKYVTADELAFLDAVQHFDPDDLDPAAGDTSTYSETYLRRSIYAHDSNFYTDPETGMPLLLVAYAYDGLKILDLSEPAAPVLLGRFLPSDDGTGHKHYVHSVTAERLADGRLIVVAGSETFEPEHWDIASPIWILDATATLEGAPLQNPPEHLSTWTNPSDAPAGRLGLSVHFFRQQDGLLYLSHYHGGIWVLDLRTPEVRGDPPALAYIMPVPGEPVPVPEGCCIGWDLEGVPMVFDVDVSQDGTVFAADIVQGVSSIAVHR